MACAYVCSTYIYLSIDLSDCRSRDLSIDLGVHPSIRLIHLIIYLSFFFFRLSYWSVDVSIDRSMYLFIYLSIDLSVHP